MLTETYDHIDQISGHAYDEELDGDLDSFLASGEHMDRYIRAVVATIDHVKALKRSCKTINISFDEWNVWYLERELKGEGLYRSEDIAGADWPVAPRVAEDVYSVVDAVVVGSLLMTIIKNAGRIGSASLSVLVNSMAPIRAEAGGPAWRQTSFHPYALTAQHVSGTVLDARVTSDTYQTALHGEVALVDVVVTHDRRNGTMTVLIVNRSRSEAAPVRLGFAGFQPVGLGDCWTVPEDDPRLTNSAEAPERVGPRRNTTPIIVGPHQVTVEVPPVSWSLLTLSGEVLDVFAGSN